MIQKKFEMRVGVTVTPHTYADYQRNDEVKIMNKECSLPARRGGLGCGKTFDWSKKNICKNNALPLCLR
jgi:hypothetical protein